MAPKAKNKYFEAVGRRKSATARVRISEADKQSIIVNDKPVNEYFQNEALQKLVREPIEATETGGQLAVTAKVSGSGLAGQAEAIRHAIARALLLMDPEVKSALKAGGYLKRDPRSKERKKFGLLKARKRPQWSKR